MHKTFVPIDFWFRPSFFHNVNKILFPLFRRSFIRAEKKEREKVSKCDTDNTQLEGRCGELVFSSPCRASVSNSLWKLEGDWLRRMSL